MAEYSYTEEELQQYFNDRTARRGSGQGDGAPSAPPRAAKPASRGRLSGFFYRRFDDPKKAQAAFVLSTLVGLGLLVAAGLLLYTLFLTVAGRTPDTSQIENPKFNLATVAYTADGQEMARYARQNRSWAPLDSISLHVIDALIATEDRRFDDHWGIDFYGLAAVAAGVITKGEVRGASTVTQQLARNLYNDQIGQERTISRKLKEMVTAVQLERNYTKPEIVEMYLNTVEFVYNAFGIEAAARTFFNKHAKDLSLAESAMIVGMLQNPSLYNPIRFPERAQQRRNVVLNQMVKYGYLDRATYDTLKANPVETDYTSSAVKASISPYFAMHVQAWLKAWGEKTGHDIYSEGLTVYTTLDSRLQAAAHEAVQTQMEKLQKVVDYEWSASNYQFSRDLDWIVARENYDPFAYYWSSNKDFIDDFIRESDAFKALREDDLSRDEALARLRDNTAFMDSLKAVKTRLESGLVAMDPRTGYVKAWVGGRNIETDWYDHVSIAKRQPGSTFKPFVYTVAIDNGYSPNYMLRDSVYTYQLITGDEWAPANSGGASGEMMTLREGLAYSKNTITAQLMMDVKPENVAFIARRMGVTSKLDEVPALALGTSDVTLLEMTTGYSTLANGGLRNDPVVVTRIEDRNGHVLYEATPTPHEALNEETAYTVVDMLRGVVQYGTGLRMRTQYGLGDYDLAGKTGTTQNSADTWFMLMHPDLVTGAWVGFNDRRVTFRSSWWGQGSHTALFVVGDFMRNATRMEDSPITDERFPEPEQEDDFDPYAAPTTPSDPNDRRVSW